LNLVTQKTYTVTGHGHGPSQGSRKGKSPRDYNHETTKRKGNPELVLIPTPTQGRGGGLWPRPGGGVRL